MSIELLTSADEFLLRTEHLRATDPFRTNILGSVATSVATGITSYDAYLWWIAKNETGEVVGAAMRTAPHGMVLSPMPLSAVEELARAISVHDDQLPSVSGKSAIVSAFVEAYKGTASAGSQRNFEVEEQLLIYSLNKLLIPSVEGVIRAAEENEYEFILDWYLKFGEDTGVLMPNPEQSVRSGLLNKSLRFWVVNGEKVAMAGHASLVETPSGSVGRIGPVYTPPEHRRKGYAGALTAMLSKELLDRGSKVMLYTDATNPTSNGVYQRIGFELIDEQQEIAFSVEDV